MTDRTSRFGPAGLLALALYALAGTSAGRRGPMGGDLGGLAAADRACQHAAGAGPGRCDAATGCPRLAGRAEAESPVFQRVRGEALDDPLGAGGRACRQRRDPGREPQASRVPRPCLGDDPRGRAGGLGSCGLRPGPARRPGGDGSREGPHGCGHRSPGSTMHLVLAGRRRGRRAGPAASSPHAALVLPVRGRRRGPRRRGRRRVGAGRLDHRRPRLAD